MKQEVQIMSTTEIKDYVGSSLDFHVTYAMMTQQHSAKYNLFVKKWLDTGRMRKKIKK
jgi:hypothetical protein